jgi:dTDP-4-amino-4,6-dideoxy-D-galactose acyltransferase
LQEDRWLSARFGHPVFTVAGADDAAAISGDGPASYQAKVDADRVGEVAALEAAGFRVVDVNVTLAREGETFPDDERVADATPEDRDELIRIAAEDYGVSRFHLDPEVPDAVASAIKRDWITACLDGERGERVLAVSADGAAAGFLAVLAGDGTRVIDLVAVAAARRGAGLGAALVKRFLTLCAEAGARAEVGSQVSNVGALRLYEELGFRTVATRYVLHRHVRPSWGAA